MRRFYIAAVLALAAAGWLQGQERSKPRPPARGKAARPASMPRMAGGGTAIDRWNLMAPAERQRELRKLPPERRKQIQQRLEQYNKLPKAERDRLRERYEQFSSLTPAKQELVRRQMRRFGEVPAERRRVLSRELTRLRKASDEDRRARINSEEFRSRYTLQEQQLMQDISENLPIRPQLAEAAPSTAK